MNILFIDLFLYINIDLIIFCNNVLLHVFINVLVNIWTFTLCWLTKKKKIVGWYVRYVYAYVRCLCVKIPFWGKIHVYRHYKWVHMWTVWTYKRRKETIRLWGFYADILWKYVLKCMCLYGYAHLSVCVRVCVCVCARVRALVIESACGCDHSL